MPDFTIPPRHLCILRLSAIGDICHTYPVVKTVRLHWPETQITWIIGKTEFELVKGIKDIDFIIYDKNSGIKGYIDIWSKLKNIEFDVLLHMQMSLRSSIISLLINAKNKLGFDKQRAKDGQWLFTNQKIEHIPRQHVIESLFGFATSLGIREKKYIWDFPVPKGAQKSADKLSENINQYVVLSPCSSKSYRNWQVDRYAKIIGYLKSKYNLDTILTGGNSEIEKQYGRDIVKYTNTHPLNLIGKTSLKELLHIIKNASFMISPDSGPAHMSTTVDTPVIGLYAATNPDRASPYLSKKWVVNRYPDAILKKYGQSIDNVAWGKRVRDSWAMELISVKDVQKMIDIIMEKLIEKTV